MRKLLKNYNTCERGAILPIFGGAILLMSASVGIAIDYGRAFSARTEIQQVLDSAVFNAAKSAVLSGKDPDAAVKQFFNATSKLNPEITVKTIGGSKKNGNVFTGSASAQVETTFMRVFGKNSLDVSVASEVIYGIDKAHAVLVLDATDSMSGSKFDTLKRASTDLVDALYETPNADQNIKIGVVPFARYVNVGLHNRGEPWLDVANDYSTTENICRTTRPVTSKSGCSQNTGTGYKDGVPYTYTYEQCTSYTYGPEETNCADETRNFVWNGCVGSRSYPLNVQDGSYGNKVPGLLNTSCSTPLTPLSSSKSSLKSAINAMTTNGDTYIPSGLAWGWRVLSSTAPFAEAASDNGSSKKVHRYLVLMTDGANTRSPNYPDHNGSNASKSNDLTAELCSNVKAEGIRVFTIAFEVSDSTIKSLLEDCASRTTDFYDATSSSKLMAAFKNIGDSMTQVRLHN